jgi:hypothetical protein
LPAGVDPLLDAAVTELVQLCVGGGLAEARLVVATLTPRDGEFVGVGEPDAVFLAITVVDDDAAGDGRCRGSPQAWILLSWPRR